MMNKILLFLAIGFATGMLSCSQQTLEKTDSLPQTYTISQERLLDKIKGGLGWTNDRRSIRRSD